MFTSVICLVNVVFAAACIGVVGFEPVYLAILAGFLCMAITAYQKMAEGIENPSLIGGADNWQDYAILLSNHLQDGLFEEVAVNQVLAIFTNSMVAVACKAVVWVMPLLSIIMPYAMGKGFGIKWAIALFGIEILCSMLSESGKIVRAYIYAVHNWCRTPKVRN